MGKQKQNLECSVLQEVFSPELVEFLLSPEPSIKSIAQENIEQTMKKYKLKAKNELI